MKRTQFRSAGIRLVWPRLVALRRDRLVLVEGRALLVVLDVDGDRLTPRGVHELSWAPATVQLSPSGRYALLGNAGGNYAEVVDLASFAVLTSVAAPEHAVSGFAALGDTEVLVFSTRPGQLEAITLAELAPVFQARIDKPQPFVPTRIVSLEDGDGVLVVGHRFLELDSVAARMSLQVLTSSPLLATRAVDEGARFAGIDVAVGPCGWEEYVVWRAGRRAEDSRLERVSLADGRVQPLAMPGEVHGVYAVLGTPDATALAGDRRLWVVSVTGELELSQPTVAESFDGERGRIALIDVDRRLEIIQLPVE